MKPINKKVLLVEDDKDYLWILRQTFENGGFLVLTAEDGERGLEVAAQEKPDLIVIDIMLPKMDGITMAKKIKAQAIHSEMIFLTNFDDPGYVGAAAELRSGAD